MLCMLAHFTLCFYLHLYYTIEFPVDLIQGGAGTSTNMNVNEVSNVGLSGHTWTPRGR
jgi:hypothetical protein